MHEFLLICTIAAITGAGVVTGLLFAFSNFVMRALSAMPPEQGMAAMQRINLEIVNPIFLVFFLGTPVFCLVVAVAGVTMPGSQQAWPLIAGAALYLIGPFGITLLFNVPLNNRLASAEPSGSEALWGQYRVHWQRWNHVRTVVGIASIVLLASGLAGIHDA